MNITKAEESYLKGFFKVFPERIDQLTLILKKKEKILDDSDSDVEVQGLNVRPSLSSLKDTVMIGPSVSSAKSVSLRPTLFGDPELKFN